MSVLESDVKQVDFDHHSPDFVKTNYDQYRKLRAECPVAHTNSYGGFWILSGYDEVSEVARDDYTFSSAGSLIIPSTDFGWLLPIQADPPAFGRYRKLLDPYLMPEAVKALEPYILEVIDESIDAFIERGEADLVREFANSVPACTTMKVLGLDPSEWRVFAEPLHEVIHTFPDTEANKKSQAEVFAFTQKIEDEVDARVKKPQVDMISKLLSSETGGQKTTRDEVVAMVRMVIFGGMNTVVDALGNIFVRMAEHPDIRKRLQSDRSHLRIAIEEFLRYDAPIQGFARFVTKETTVGGQKIKAGEKIFMLWASANRDETVFGESSDQLDIDRWPNRHMAFGVGGHHCQGSILARTELRMMLDRVFNRLPDYEVLLDKVVEAETIGSSYGPRAVPAVFTPGTKVHVSRRSP